MTIASRDALLARREQTDTGFPEDTVDIPGIGEVRVRGLSRHEVLHLQSVKGGPAAVERVTVHLGLIEPALSEAEVGTWQRASVGAELDAVTRKIGELSGMLPDSRKAAYKDFEVDPGSEFRVLPGAEADDDGGEAADGTE